MKTTILFINLFFLTLSVNADPISKTFLMKSPDGAIRSELLYENNRLQYSVAGERQILLYSSRLGLEVNGVAYGTDATCIRLLKKEYIKNKNNPDSSFNAYSFSITEQGQDYRIEFRLSNLGFAFRYIFDHGKDHDVTQELTEFALPQARVWFFERNSSWKLKSYAGLWQSTTTDSLHIISSEGPVQGKPLLYELPGKKYVMLTEAALYGYSGLRFKGLGNRKLQANYTEKEGFRVRGKLVTPWRVLLYARNLDELVNNTLINDLNPNPDQKLYADKSYIRPGRAVWSWITRTDNYMQPEEEMNFIDAASQLNFEYTLLDEGWESKWPDKWTQLKEICTFAAQKKVGVWVWKTSKALRDSSIRDAFLDSVRDAGVAGIKTDFMDSEAKDLVDFEIGFLKACAERNLMVNFHGCHPPTGESKTYPNEMTREGIRGMELNIMKEPIPAWHNAALPFTRLVLGHGDYTPGLFYNKANTTYTHQLALFYLFNSPFQCLAENPVKLLADETFKPVIPMLKTLPVTWDETIVLQGSAIGELAAFAKRKGNIWYIVAINGTAEKKTILLRPDFLKKSATYNAVSINDTPGKDGFLKQESILGRNDKKDLVIGANGGLIIELKPIK